MPNKPELTGVKFDNLMFKPPAFEPAKYMFSVDTVRIDNTRSWHDDTDFFSASIADPAGSSFQIGPNTVPMADVNNGTYNINLRVGPVAIGAPDEQVSFAFAGVNSGYGDEKTIVGALQDGVKALQAAKLAGGSWWATVLIEVIDYLIPILFADCDGPVAGDKFVFTGSQLWEMTNWATAKAPFSSKAYPGTDTPVGCGSNSVYWVTCSVLGLGTYALPPEGFKPGIANNPHGKPVLVPRFKQPVPWISRTPTTVHV